MYQFGDLNVSIWCFHWSISMPTKPSKEINDALQSILEKLANLQTKLHTTQEHHEGRYLALQQALETWQATLES